MNEDSPRWKHAIMKNESARWLGRFEEYDLWLLPAKYCVWMGATINGQSKDFLPGSVSYYEQTINHTRDCIRDNKYSPSHWIHGLVRARELGYIND